MEHEQCMEYGTSSSSNNNKKDPAKYNDNTATINSPPSSVRTERTRADDVFETCIGSSNNSSELAFLITHYLKHFDLETSTVQPTTTTATSPSTTEASCFSSSTCGEVVGRIRELAQELAQCWEQLGAFGVRLKHPIGSSSATSRGSSGSIYRNASYIDIALGQYPSVPPNRLQQILTASHYCTITSLQQQQQQQAIFGGSGSQTNLLQFQQQQQADNHDETKNNDDAIANFSTTNTLQLPPILFAPYSSVVPHTMSKMATTTTTAVATTTSSAMEGSISTATPPITAALGRGRPSNNTSTAHYYSYRLVLPTTASPPAALVGNASSLQLQQQQRYLSLPVLSDPTLFPKVISDVARTYLTQKEECSYQKRILIKLQRDLSFQQQQLKQLNPSTERIHSFLTQSIQERSIQDLHLQQKLSNTKQDLYHYYNLYRDSCQSYQNPFDTKTTNTTHRSSIVSYNNHNILNLLPSSNSLRNSSNPRQYRMNNIPTVRKHILSNKMTHIVTINSHLFYPVYCLRMDKTGTYFISGADDHLAKLFRLGNSAHRTAGTTTTTNITNHKNTNNSSITYSQHHGATLICTLKGHAGVITDIDVSVDNALLATASEDGDCRIWGLRDGSPIAILRGHMGGVTMVSFSLTTPYHLTTTAEDGFARLWDVREATMKRYVSVVGNRTEYKSIPTTNNNNNNSINSTIGTSTSGNRLNPVVFHTNEPSTINPSATGIEAITTHTAVSIPTATNNNDNTNDEVDANLLPLPPIPIRQIHRADHGNHSNNNNVQDNILPPIPIAQPPIIQQQPPPPIPVPQFREFQPAVPINGNDESILDEGVRLLAKLNHGPPDEGNEGMPFIETRSQRRKLKVVCLSRNPLGGQFATGCEDGVGRIWSDVDSVYSEGMRHLSHKTKSMDSSSAVASTSSPVHQHNYSGSLLYSSACGTISSPQSSSRPPVKPCYLLATLTGHLNAITDLQYSNRGDRILTASQKDGVVRIWSWDNASEFDTMMHDHFHSYTTRTMTTITRAKGLQNLRQIMIRLVPLLDTANGAAGGHSSSSSSNRAAGAGRRGAASRVGSSTTTATANSVSGSAVQCDVAAWTAHDLYIVTSQSIVSRQAPPLQALQVWDSRDGQCLLSIQGAHASSCNIVLPHPVDPYILMSAGSDGVAHVWDISSGTKLFSYENRLTHGSMAEPEHKNKLCAILDGCWNETSGVIILTDDSGRILLIDVACQCPTSTTALSLAPSWMKEQYFASDYYEMIYDTHGYALDARSQLPPHLAPRAVRCTHTGTSVGDPVNYELLHLRGPWPISEAESSDRRKILLSRAFDVRHGGLKEFCNTWKPSRSCGSSNSFILSKPYGGVLIHGPNAQNIPHAPTSNKSNITNASHVVTAATVLPSSRSARTVGTNNRPARPLSSRYHYLGYEDIISSEEEENNDEDFVPAAPTVAESVSDASHDELELSSSASDMDMIDLSSASSPRRPRRGRTAAQGRSLGARHSSTSAQQGNQRTTSGSGQRSPQLQHRRRTAQRTRLGRTRADDSNNTTAALRRSSTKRDTHMSKKRYEESDDESVSEIEELLSSNRRPESRDAYNGQYYDDLQRGHLWKVPRGSEVFKDWLRRDESKTGYTGKKTYAPQVGDSVVYIPRAHYDTIIKHPATMMITAPWKSFPANSSWPVVLCKVTNVRYRFPVESLLKEERSVVAIVSLEVTGIPTMRSEGGFQWPMPEFIHQRSRRSACFEVSLFQSEQVEFLIPEALYLWRQVSLEAAIRQNMGNPEGIEVYMFAAADRSEDFAEDAALVRHPATIKSVSGMVVTHNEHGNPHVHFESSGQLSNERHFERCGYDSIQIKWEDGSDGNSCLWELNVASMPIGDVPTPSGIKEAAQIRLLETLTSLITDKDDSRIKDFFLLPVDTRRYSDYDLMIEVPMDLSLVRKRLENSYYSNLQSFMNDIKLIKENCCKYNDEHSEITLAAHQLLLTFQDEVREIEANVPPGDLDPEQIQKSLLEKINAIQLPTYEKRSGTIDRRVTQSALEVSKADSPYLRPTRGRISGSLDNMSTVANATVGTRQLRSGRPSCDSINFNTPSASSTLQEAPTCPQTRAKRKHSPCEVDNKSRDLVPQSKTLKRSSPSSDGESFSANAEEDTSEISNSDAEDEDCDQSDRTNHNMHQEKRVTCTRSSRVSEQSSRQLNGTEKDSSCYGSELNKHNFEKNVVRTRASNAAQVPSLRKRTAQKPSNDDDHVLEETPEPSIDNSSHSISHGMKQHNVLKVAPSFSTQREPLPRRVKEESIKVTECSTRNETLHNRNTTTKCPSNSGVKTRSCINEHMLSPSSRSKKEGKYYVPGSDDDSLEKERVNESEYERSTSSECTSHDSDDESYHHKNRAKTPWKSSIRDRAHVRSRRTKANCRGYQNKSEDAFSSTSECTSDTSAKVIKKGSRKANRKSKSIHGSKKVTIRRKIASKEDEEEEYSSSSSDYLSTPSKRSAKIHSHQKLSSPSKKTAKRSSKKSSPVDPFDVSPWPDINSKKTTTVARAIIQSLIEMDNDAVFNAPVIEKFPNLKESYLKLVSKPMDFSTIEKSVRKYQNIQDLQQDILLVFKNCCLYNGQESEMGKYAITISKQLPDIFENACKSNNAFA